VPRSARNGEVSGSPLRHPAELPFYVFMVILNLLLIWLILQAAVTLPYLPDKLRDTGWATAVRTAFIGLLLLVPALIVVRETQRASVRGTAVELNPRQYGEIYQTADDFAHRLGLRRRPRIFLANGNGTLNAFAAQATGNDYVVLTNELFTNLRQNNREGLRFILGHELGHIRLHHVGLWYQLSIAYSGRIPVLGPTLSRLREYSCDRHGAHLSPGGAAGLVLLTSGRHTEHTTDVEQLLRQGRALRGFWVWLAQLPRSHPFTVRRLERLFELGLLRGRSREPSAHQSPRERRSDDAGSGVSGQGVRGDSR